MSLLRPLPSTPEGTSWQSRSDSPSLGWVNRSLWLPDGPVGRRLPEGSAVRPMGGTYPDHDHKPSHVSGNTQTTSLFTYCDDRFSGRVFRVELKCFWALDGLGIPHRGWGRTLPSYPATSNTLSHKTYRRPVVFFFVLFPFSFSIPNNRTCRITVCVNVHNDVPLGRERHRIIPKIRDTRFPVSVHGRGLCCGEQKGPANQITPTEVHGLKPGDGVYGLSGRHCTPKRQINLLTDSTGSLGTRYELRPHFPRCLYRT